MIGAVDIGGTKISAAMIQPSGAILLKGEWPTRAFPAPEGAMAKVAEWLISSSSEVGKTCSGIGVACTGPVNPFTGTIGNVDLLPGWDGFPLTDFLARQTGLAVVLENDADAAALAEAFWGAGKNASRFVYVTVSTGIGTGLTIDGDLYRGVNGSHPEMGHHCVDASGPFCSCGSQGCWEALASGPAMVNWVNQNAPGERLPVGFTARDICILARQGEPFALRAIANEAKWLGIGIANIVTLFCPDTIAIGGGVMESHDLFLDPIRAAVRSRCTLVPCEQVKILPAALGNNSALIGAARVWQQHFDNRRESLAS